MEIIITLAGIVEIKNGKVLESKPIKLKGSISTKSVNKFFEELDFSTIKDQKELSFFKCFSTHRKNFPITRITFGKTGGPNYTGGHNYMRNHLTGIKTKINTWDTIRFCGQDFIFIGLKME